MDGSGGKLVRRRDPDTRAYIVGQPNGCQGTSCSDAGSIQAKAFWRALIARGFVFASGLVERIDKVANKTTRHHPSLAMANGRLQTLHISTARFNGLTYGQ